MQNNQQTSQTSPKRQKRLGMRYFRFVYAVQCPLVAFTYAFFGFSCFYMPMQGFVMGALAAVLFFVEAGIALITMIEFWKCDRDKKYPVSLYRLTQVFIWGTGLCWGILYTLLGASIGAMAVSIILAEVVFLIIPFFQFLYFRRRRSIYGLPLNEQVGADESEKYQNTTDGEGKV